MIDGIVGAAFSLYASLPGNMAPSQKLANACYTESQKPQLSDGYKVNGLVYKQKFMVEFYKKKPPMNNPNAEDARQWIDLRNFDSIAVYELDEDGSLIGLPILKGFFAKDILVVIYSQAYAKKTSECFGLNGSDLSSVLKGILDKL